ncbi:MAG TPA: hypothetical protein VMB77_11040 [Syntrophales bacterium]|nr:hypothetical protein [Syntrophales bacterium]
MKVLLSIVWGAMCIIHLRNRFLPVLFAVTVICVLLSSWADGLCFHPNALAESLGSMSVSTGHKAAKDSGGPTLLLGYGKEEFKKNPISSFMYFVPLISRTQVDREISADNDQQVGIIKYEKKVTSGSFRVVCEFEIWGRGFHKTTYDAEGMISSHLDDSDEGKSLTHILDYIKIEGQGFGRIEVNGTLTGDTPSVVEVSVEFNAGGHKSPVTVGLYDIKPTGGQYKYENRSNQIVARVNSIVFKKTAETTPRMGITMASVTDQSGPDGFYGAMKGVIANLFIRPPKVARLGNETMLDFGRALLEQKSEFTFPKAINIKKENRLMATGSAKK